MATKILKESFIHSKDQVANILTRPPSTVRFNLLHSYFTISLIQAGVRGAIEANTQDKIPIDFASTKPLLAKAHDKISSTTHPQAITT